MVDVRDDGEIAYALHQQTWRPREAGRGIIASRPPQQPLQLRGIEPLRAHRHRIQQQHRDFQAIAALQLRIGIHIEAGEFGQCDPAAERAQLLEHYMAQVALRTHQQRQPGRRYGTQRRPGPPPAGLAVGPNTEPPEGANADESGPVRAPVGLAASAAAPESAALSPGAGPGALARRPAPEAGALLETLAVALASGPALRIARAIKRTVSGGTSPTAVTR